ncbi:MAG: SPFH domain-containing protein [Polyangiales bacterium]
MVSYTGRHGADLSGNDYKHGELVEPGQRGVWSAPLLPGKYAFNTYAGKVIPVPTTNFILKWNRREVGAHRFDENLAEVSLITKDAFEPSLPLSVVVHIDYRKAPLVIQRFGDVKKLVEQTLDPMVAAYFKNVGQTRTLIELIQERSAIQEER